eukprot:m.123135 g.123135  ORF g.123135 m.123135 type:complete len:263 (+) comp52144_c0_seq1:56-844(+)
MDNERFLVVEMEGWVAVWAGTRLQPLALDASTIQYIAAIISDLDPADVSDTCDTLTELFTEFGKPEADEPFVQRLLEDYLEEKAVQEENKKEALAQRREEALNQQHLQMKKTLEEEQQLRLQIEQQQRDLDAAALALKQSVIAAYDDIETSDEDDEEEPVGASPAGASAGRTTRAPTENQLKKARKTAVAADLLDIAPMWEFLNISSSFHLCSDASDVSSRYGEHQLTGCCASGAGATRASERRGSEGRAARQGEQCSRQAG